MCPVQGGNRDGLNEDPCLHENVEGQAGQKSDDRPFVSALEDQGQIRVAIRPVVSTRARAEDECLALDAGAYLAPAIVLGGIVALASRVAAREQWKLCLSKLLQPE